MKTEELIDLIVRAERPAERLPPPATAAAALAGAYAVAMLLTIGALGVRADIGAALLSAGLWMKFGFAAMVLVSAGSTASALATPGRDWRRRGRWIALPFALIATAAGVALATTGPAAYGAVVLGRTWSVCLVAIPTLATAAMLVAGVGFRRLAPTDLHLAGSAVGLASGGAAALAYALYCPEESPAFAAVWYVLGLTASALIGWLIGPRLLRW